MKAPIFLTITVLACAATAQTVLVKPYVQPGNGATLDGTDVKVLTWLTDQKPGEFTVEFGVPGRPIAERPANSPSRSAALPSP